MAIRKLLMIGENTDSFMFKTIKSALHEEGIDCEFVLPDPLQIGDKADKCDDIIIFAGDYLEDSMGLIVYLKDFLKEKERKLSIIGFSGEIDKIEKVVTETLVFGKYERPINVKDLAKRIKADIEFKEEQNYKKTILIVDDSGSMLRTAKGWLEKKYNVLLANSAMMAMTTLATNKPDLIICDFEMPICNGPQFIEMIKAEEATANIPFIFLTSKGDLESIKRVLKLKPDGYLLKSMGESEIVSYIDEFFEKRKATML